MVVLILEIRNYFVFSLLDYPIVRSTIERHH